MSDDANATYGRVRVYPDAQFSYVLSKEEFSDTCELPIVVRAYLRVLLVAEDLYDFNDETPDPANKAAIVQIGRGKGARPEGQIYKTRVIVDRKYLLKEIPCVAP
jgi:hypothetical protein